MSKRHVTVWAMLPALFVFVSCSRQKTLDDATLRTADQDTGNWVMYGRTYDDHRFSPLNQINEQTVGKLGLAWSRELGTTRGLEATPLVEDGIIYTTGSWSMVYAVDAKTGDVRWTYDPKVPRENAYFICCDVVNRGAALYKGKVYVGTLDGRLIALDEHTGTPVWTAATTDNAKQYSITGAPRIAKGLVIIGNAGAENGVRGYVSAYDAETGKLAWRTYTVPGDPSKGFESKAMEAAAKTWSGEWWKTGGGGPAWEGIVYDPALDLLYFGTANATAWYRAIRGGGDSLYTASILAVHASNGELAWYFQTTPGENWDYDATQPLMQADLTIAGRPRKVIMQANKNGFFYVLDRETGEFISGAPFVSGVTWATGLDPKTGRPIEAPGVAAMKPVIVSPSPDGAHNWNPMAFSPATGLVYLGAKAGTQFLHAPDPKWKYDSERSNLGLDGMYDGALNAKLIAMPPAAGELVAWDPVAQKAAWRVTSPTVENGGVLATGGNLVFQGRADGLLAAYRATDGKQLWTFDAGTGIMAPPVTYTVDGTQYLSVMVGLGGAPGLFNGPGSGPVKYGYGRILTFNLNGTATLKAPPYGHKEPPAPAIATNASPKTVHEGNLLFNANCGPCHGINVVAGPMPDLRYASKEIHQDFENIVLGGTRASAGMPSFKNILNAAQVRAIQAYIVARARESAKPSEGQPK
ncbi:MAG TPA: PQQ-dependent dehydrogenase, methanol/ethanol family [Bryobacteraceae bacterium]|jgi:PQQ-dependent dehydrogenase (methanol/ethanol family)|nr:PQQ-dependent dehydrogenase, methanol/ethanol family [Bryobacteraceae bacterium]